MSGKLILSPFFSRACQETTCPCRLSPLNSICPSVPALPTGRASFLSQPNEVWQSYIAAFVFLNQIFNLRAFVAALWKVSNVYVGRFTFSSHTKRCRCNRCELILSSKIEHQQTQNPAFVFHPGAGTPSHVLSLLYDPRTMPNHCEVVKSCTVQCGHWWESSSSFLFSCFRGRSLQGTEEMGSVQREWNDYHVPGYSSSVWLTSAWCVIGVCLNLSVQVIEPEV